jgi:hypothetical protein
LSVEYGLLELGFFIIGVLIGNHLENTPRRKFRKRKYIFKLAIILGCLTILTYSLDEIFNVSSISFVIFWIGIISGYFGTLIYYELQKSKLELIRGFAKAGTSKD